MIAIVLAYRRIELVETLLSLILRAESEFSVKHNKQLFSRIIIVHDGIRLGESKEAEIDHKQMRLKISTIKQDSSRAETILYDSNVGLTCHMFRIVKDLNLNVSECVFFEEDKAPTLRSLEFLQANSALINKLHLIDTLPINCHPQLKGETLGSLITDNGNMVLSSDLFEFAIKLYERELDYKNDFEDNLYTYLSSFLKGFGLARAFRFLSKKISWGLTNKDRPDSLFAYALLSRKKLKTCPSEPLSENWSDRDSRGKNVSILPRNRANICASPAIELWGYRLCPKCEKQAVSERVGLTLGSTFRNSMQYRLKVIGDKLSR